MEDQSSLKTKFYALSPVHLGFLQKDMTVLIFFTQRATVDHVPHSRTPLFTTLMFINHLHCAMLPGSL